MDNFHIDVTGEKSTALALALELGFHQCHGSTTIGYKLEVGDYRPQTNPPRRPRMILCWYATNGMLPFPVPLTHGLILPIIEAWLEAVDYGDEPDHDGDNGKGWRVYNEDWGHVGSDPYAFLAIEPAWAMYGK